MEVLGQNEKNNVHRNIERHMVLALLVHVAWGAPFWWVEILRCCDPRQMQGAQNENGCQWVLVPALGDHSSSFDVACCHLISGLGTRCCDIEIKGTWKHWNNCFCYSVPFEVVHLLEELFSHPWLRLQSPRFHRLLHLLSPCPLEILKCRATDKKCSSNFICFWQWQLSPGEMMPGQIYPIFFKRGSSIARLGWVVWSQLRI